MLLVGRQGGHPACKNRVVGCWHGYLSGARCRLACDPADATATHCLLLQWNPDWFAFWYRLIRVVPEKGPLNMCILLCVDCDGAGVHGTGRLLQSVAVCWARRSWTTRSVSAREATWWRHKHRAVGLRTAAAEVGRRNRPTFIQPRRWTHLRWAALWVAEIVFSLNTSQCARVFTFFLTNTLPP